MLTLRTELEENGYAVLRGALGLGMVARLRELAESLPPKSVSQGLTDTVTISHDEQLFQDLIACSPAVDELVACGWGDVRYFGHALIHKPQGERRRNWHLDWWGFNDPISLGPIPPQLGCAYYLQDTTAEGGALTVLPGTHCNQPAAAQIASLSKRPTEHCEGEIPLEVQAGDVCLFDARVMHCSQANQSLKDRVGITVWYFPCYDKLAVETQTYAATGTHGIHEFVGRLAPEMPTHPAEPNRAFWPAWWPK